MNGLAEIRALNEKRWNELKLASEKKYECGCITKAGVRSHQDARAYEHSIVHIKICGLHKRLSLLVKNQEGIEKQIKEIKNNLKNLNSEYSSYNYIITEGQ